MVLLRFSAAIALSISLSPCSLWASDEGPLLPVNIDKQEVFFTIANLQEDGEIFQGQFDKYRNDNPSRDTHFLWGLRITDINAVRDFLSQRPLRCHTVYSDEDVSAVDCYASPKTNGELRRGTQLTEDWISLYVWFPQIGWAERRCSDNVPRHRMAFKPPLGSFTCPRPGYPDPYRYLGYPLQ